MIKEHISSGKTIDDAVDIGLESIGLDRDDDVSIEVLETPSKGFLGIGSTLAKVKLSYEVPDEKQPESVTAQAKAAPPKKEKIVKKEAVQQEVKETIKKEGQSSLTEAELSFVKVFVTELMAKMKIENCTVTVEEKTEDASIAVSVSGDAGGAIIGRHGETLDALQYIISLFVNKNKDRAFVRVNFDAENYREKRKETLERLARQKASIAVKKKGTIAMEPMQAYERRIIHASLQDFENITTYSVGEEPRRRVVIAYAHK